MQEDGQGGAHTCATIWNWGKRMGLSSLEKRQGGPSSNLPIPIRRLSRKQSNTLSELYSCVKETMGSNQTWYKENQAWYKEKEIITMGTVNCSHSCPEKAGRFHKRFHRKAMESLFPKISKTLMSKALSNLIWIQCCSCFEQAELQMSQMIHLAWVILW